MSQKATPIAAVPSDESPEVVEKQNLIKRGINFVKSHKKAAIAVAGLVVLVGAGAVFGRDADDDSVALPSDEQQEDLEDTAVTE